MRTSLTLLALLVMLSLWCVGLWRGRPWPVTIALQAPGALQEAFTPKRAPDPRPARDEGTGAPPRPFSARLTPRAGTPHLEQALACAPSRLTVEVQDAFGRSRGLEQIAVGWPAREGGYGVLEPQVQGPTTFALTGRGLAPPPTLHLTSLGGLFDGQGTLEVTARCAD